MKIFKIITLIFKSIFFKNKQNRKFLKSEEFQILRERVNVFDEDLNTLLATDCYINHLQLKYIKKKYEGLHKEINSNAKAKKNEEMSKFLNDYSNLKQTVNNKNKLFVKSEIEKEKNIFDNIDGKSLDIQQRTAVVLDDINNLVVAGAGSGKTLTISAKAKYLVETGRCKASELLLISFTKQSALEMKERISKKLGIKIDVKTFHKLGLDIISKQRGIKPEIDSNLGDAVDHFFENELHRIKNLVSNLITFFAYYVQVPKNVSDFENVEQYNDYMMSMDYETLLSKAKIDHYIDDGKDALSQKKRTFNNEVVKSFEELMIANFLYLNNINYIYEKQYEFPTGDEYHRSYRPDFYLTDYDIYLEHFGIDRAGNTPQYSEVEQIKYKEGMKWKREIHQRNKTTLIESYSYWNSEGVLLEKLERLLKSHGVAFNERDKKEVFESVYQKTENRFFEEFKKLIITFISLFKSQGYSANHFENLYEEVSKSGNSFLNMRHKLFFTIVKPIYEYYQNKLYRSDSIDFNDMINDATQIINKKNVILDYRYIIIDEYQDISHSRYKLIKSIKDMTNAKLLCVGDDWQSIYRFAGSDISLFSQFKNFYGPHTIAKIEKTYRNSQQLIDVAGKFVMKNHSQIKKNLKSDKQLESPIEVLLFDTSKVEALKSAINRIVNDHGPETDIILIGRNNFDINFLKDSIDFKLRFTGKLQEIDYKMYPKLKLTFMSAHKSKGLEGTNIIIVNGDKGKLGFPNQISDDPVLAYVLNKAEDYIFAEERRLFYVALTRTKNKTYILSKENKTSIFVDELIKNHKVNVDKNLTNGPSKNVKCSKCLVGNLIQRKAEGRPFVACSNYPTCDFTANDITILDNTIQCDCGSYMVKRKGPYGEFYGCLNYPYCKNNKKIG